MLCRLQIVLVALFSAAAGSARASEPPESVGTVAASSEEPLLELSDEGSEPPSPFLNADVSRSGRVLRPNGLWPIWENTGVVLGHGRAYLGSHFLGVGLGGRFQLGTSPIRLALKTPSLSLKVQIMSGPRLAVATHLEVLWFLRGSDRAFTMSNFASRLDTSAHGYTVAPLGVTASWAPLSRLFVHITATGQLVASPALPAPQVAFGLNGQLEWAVFDHHALALHAAEVGLHRHDFLQVAGSYRYHRGIFEASVGYAARFYLDGMLFFPAASLGIEL